MSFLRPRKSVHLTSSSSSSTLLTVDKKRIESLQNTFIEVKTTLSSEIPNSVTSVLTDLETWINYLSRHLDEILTKVSQSVPALFLAFPPFTHLSSTLGGPGIGKWRQSASSFSSTNSAVIPTSPSTASSASAGSSHQAQQLVVIYINRVLVSVDDHLKILQQLSAKYAILENGALLEKKLTHLLHRSQAQSIALYQELITFFPITQDNGVSSEVADVNWRFVCAKTEADQWWNKHFHDCFFVDWDDFFAKFEEVCAQLDNSFIQHELQQTMNICGTDYISKFAFDVFTRLFSPWSKMSSVWSGLAMEHPGYLGLTTYDRAKEALLPYKTKPGSYVFRFSTTHLGFWSIAYVKDGGQVAQVLLRDRTLVEALTQGARKRVYMYPYGRMFNPDRQSLQEEAQPVHLDVYSSHSTLRHGSSSNSGSSDRTVQLLNHSSSQSRIRSGAFRQMSDNGTTVSPASSPMTPSGGHTNWAVDDVLLEEMPTGGLHAELCKICFSRSKDTKMEPCGHLMCRYCLNNWMGKSDDCPFCRTMIRSIRRLTVVPNPT